MRVVVFGGLRRFFSDIQFKEDGLFMHRSSVLEYYKVGLET